MSDTQTYLIITHILAVLFGLLLGIGLILMEINRIND